MKQCRKCGGLKDESEFYVANKKTGTLRNDCKACKVRTTMDAPGRLESKKRYRESDNGRAVQSAYHREYREMHRLVLSDKDRARRVFFRTGQ